MGVKKRQRREEEVRLLSVISSNEAGGTGCKLKYRKCDLNLRRNFY